MTNLSRTFRVRPRAPAGRSGIGSVCESMVMHQLGHSRAQIMHEVHAGSINRIEPCWDTGPPVCAAALNGSLSVIS
jgi:hypothetical protein